MDNLLLANAVSAAGLAVLVLDAADRIILANNPAACLLGRTPQDLIGHPIGDYLDLAANTGAANRLAGNGAQPLTFRAARWVDPAGLNRCTVILHDAAAELASRRSTQTDLIRSDNAIRGANIGVFEYDPATQTVSVSDIWLRMLELGPHDTVDVQAEWRSRVHPDDLAAALQSVDLCASGQAERASCEYRLYARDRSTLRWLRTDIAVAERDDAGKPTLLVGAQTDISDRKSLEEALRVSVEQFRSAFENAPIGKAIVNLNGAWLRVNPALCNLLGYSEAALLGSDFQSVTHPDDLDADMNKLKLLIRGDIASYSMEKRYCRADGSIMWGALSVGMVRNAKGDPDHFIAQIVDLTDQRRLDTLKTEFVSVVSHELRTPLTSILGALSLLQTYDDATYPDEVQRLLFIAKTNGDRLHTLINDILDFQKFSAREMRFSVSPQAVAALIDETLLASLGTADTYGLRFTTLNTDRTLIGLTDPKRFHQVMANLLSNAAKFADPGSAVDVSAERQGAMIRVSVTNTGIGISEAFRDRVFRPFSQARSLTALRAGGTGLGLSISKTIVEQMGGQIGFESVPQARTTFWFTLPVADARRL